MNATPVRLWPWIWLGLAATVVVVGSVGALAGPRGSSIASFALAAAAAAVVAYACQSGLRSVRPLRVLEIALTCALGSAAVIGLGNLIGPAAVAISLVVIASCPMVVGSILAAVRSTPADTAPREPADPPVCVLTITELCAAWQASGNVLIRLQHGGPVAAQARVVHSRQLYLDELEARNPYGFARWMECDQPASNPRPYLLSPPPAT